MELVAGDLLLRRPTPADVDDIAAACSDPEIARFIPHIRLPYTREMAAAFVAGVERAWETSDERTFAIVRREGEELLGIVTIRLHDEGSIGYWLKREARGAGVMTEAVRAVVDWAAGQGIARLWITAHPDNLASQRVAEKAGFTRVGLAPHGLPFADGTTVAVRFELGS